MVSARSMAASLSSVDSIASAAVTPPTPIASARTATARPGRANVCRSPSRSASAVAETRRREPRADGRAAERAHGRGADAVRRAGSTVARATTTSDLPITGDAVTRSTETGTVPVRAAVSSTMRGATTAPAPTPTTAPASAIARFSISGEQHQLPGREPGGLEQRELAPPLQHAGADERGDHQADRHQHQ